ncbi:MAG: undecaprenyl-diphosphate phosphatase [Sphingomonas bacterium]
MSVGWLDAALLGVVEGLTEFIPVSSTGHLILAGTIFGIADADVLDVVIQLGAILAMCWAYRERLVRVAGGILRGDARAYRFALAIFLGVAPSLVVGALAHDFIKSRLFSIHTVVWAMLLGGIAILVIERRFDRPGDSAEGIAEDMPLRLAFGIGLCQLLSLVPGVSRSGATILGGVALGADRRAATEFSFFLAIPTMFAASGYDLLKASATLEVAQIEAIAIGFVVAFIVALIAIRLLIRFVAHHDFTGFGIYRIAVGGAALAWLYLG